MSQIPSFIGATITVRETVGVARRPKGRPNYRPIFRNEQNVTDAIVVDHEDLSWLEACYGRGAYASSHPVIRPIFGKPNIEYV